MKEKILDILKEINPYEEIDETTQLIEDEILDSLTLVMLINEIERTFDIEVPESQLQPECFENVLKIEALVRELMGLEESINDI